MIYLVKIISKFEITSKQLERTYKEIIILKSIYHPNIVNLIDVFENDSKIFMILEMFFFIIIIF